MEGITYIEETGLTTPGKYLAEVESAVVSRYRVNRKAYAATIDWTYKVVEGEHAGAFIKTDTPLDSGMLFLLYRTLTALGIRPEREWTFEYDDADGRLIDPDVVGRLVTVRVAEHEGRPRVRVAQAQMEDASTRVS